jgi:hypothetical protein
VVGVLGRQGRRGRSALSGFSKARYSSQSTGIVGRYTNELRLQAGLTAPVREAVRTSVVNVAGITLAHV